MPGPASSGARSSERASKASSIGAYFDTNGVLVKEALEADVDALLAQLKSKAKTKSSSSSSSSESESSAPSSSSQHANNTTNKKTKSK